MSHQPPHPKLSVLELVPVAKGASTTEALENTTELAKHAESLGYQRFWVAEHHNMPGIASSSPAVLIAHLAANTSSIRVGSGGVMLPNHAPLVVAEQFGMLESLHPGRIDLGLGRAPGTDGRTALALRRSLDGLSAEDFPRELAEVMGMLAGDPDRMAAVPKANTMPQVWLLGSSGFSAQLAGMLGLPFSFAHHFSAANTETALALYRSSFRPSEFLDEPYSMIGVNAIAAGTDEEAAYLAKPGVLAFLRLRTGRPAALDTPVEAAKYTFSSAELNFVADRRRGQLLGSKETVRQQLADLIDRTQVNELMLTSQVYGLQARTATLETVSELVKEGLPVNA